MDLAQGYVSSLRVTASPLGSSGGSDYSDWSAPEFTPTLTVMSQSGAGRLSDHRITPTAEMDEPVPRLCLTGIVGQESFLGFSIALPSGAKSTDSPLIDVEPGDLLSVDGQIDWVGFQVRSMAEIRRVAGVSACEALDLRAIHDHPECFLGDIGSVRHSRVELSTGGFIHANRTLMDTTGDGYIMTTYPSMGHGEAAGNFWRMVIEQGASVIVNLADRISIRQKVHSEPYWPAMDEVLELGGIVIQCVSEETLSEGGFRREFEVSAEGGEVHKVTQLHIDDWGDFEGFDTKRLIALVDAVTLHTVDTTDPVVVHCRAGVGRTGVFVALREVVRQLQLAEGEACDITWGGLVDLILKLRADRNELIVQTEGQFYCLRAAILDYILRVAA